MQTIKFKKLHPDAVAPRYGSAAAAAADIFALTDTVIPPGIVNRLPLDNSALKKCVPKAGRVLVKTGLALELPKGYKAEIHSRSGLSLKEGIEVGAGLIDEDYKGEIGVVLYNFSNEPVTIPKDKAIAQIKIEKYEQGRFVEVNELSETDRGTGGFGSTDV